jgi:hypothetical protein
MSSRVVRGFNLVSVRSDISVGHEIDSAKAIGSIDSFRITFKNNQGDSGSSTLL